MDFNQLSLRLLVSLLGTIMVSGIPMKDVLVSSYYQSVKNAKLYTNKKTTVIRLYSRSLFSFVRITDTVIDAGKNNKKTNPDTLIELEAFGVRRVLIKSKTHGTYVCFNKSSDVVVRKTSFDPGCMFFKRIDRRKRYTTFQSAYNNTWYLGFRKNKFGLPKSGRKTSSTQRSIQFVERSPT